MAKGPIRHVGKTGAKRPPDLGATPGLVKTAHGDVVPVTAPLVFAVPIVVNPQALRRRVEALEQEALSIIEAAVRVPEAGINEDQYRAHRIRLQAAGRILGFRKGGLPRSLVEAAGPSKPIRLRWGDARPVNMPLHTPRTIDVTADSEDDDNDS
jgi:hypothetical protein